MALNNKSFLVIGLVLFLVSAGTSFAVFQSVPSTDSTSTVQSNFPAGSTGGIEINPNEPKDQACPLNGAMYTKTEANIWATRRPLAIMIENSTDARPHSGLVRSDLVYETVAEGGVTRFMAVYLCDAARNNVVVAPVRSVRTYFIDWASEYGLTPLFAHVGGANCSGEKLASGGMGPCLTDPRAQAIEQLVKYDWRYVTGNDLDQFSVGAKAYIRNEARLGKPVATEHSVEGRTDNLWNVGKERGWTNLDPEGVEWTKSFKPWKFKDDAAEADRGNVNAIAYDFWSGYDDYAVSWTYDRATNSYLRSTGNQPQQDLETKQPVTAKNVVVQFTKETPSVDVLKHSLYQTTGTVVGGNKALIFQDGKVIEARWQKKHREDRTVFTDAKGQEITFNRGRIWLSIVDSSNKVAYPTQ